MRPRIPSVRPAVAVLSLGALLLAAGCDRYRDRQVPFDGYLFKSKARAVDKKLSRADFTATIWPVSQSLKGTREAARYEGTKYCIAEYGTSQVDWTIGPDTPAEQFMIVDDTLTFSGRCDP